MSAVRPRPASPNPEPDPSAVPGAIVRPGPDRRVEAIHALLARDRAAAQRFLSFAQDSRMRLDGIWSRVGTDGRFSATVLAAASPGRTATIFVTPARHAEDVAPLGELVDTACRGLATLGVDLGQALVDPREPLQVEVFQRGGMRRLATLSYLERPLHRSATPAPVAFPSGFIVEHWDPARRDELIETLERTYVDTLDCPDLAGLRRGEDILDGHLHSGRHEPTLWTVARFTTGPDTGRPAGVCLLNSSPAFDGGAGSIELVYLGLVPESRGKGLGAALLAHALFLLRERSERTIVLAVDERNQPALRLYRDAGFRQAIRRIAFIRPRVDEARSTTA